MLVIHGDKDYRVPIGEALRLWYDLQKRGVPSKFLYFPDENRQDDPGNTLVWYQTVLAFLGEHVLGEVAAPRYSDEVSRGRRAARRRPAAAGR